MPVNINSVRQAARIPTLRVTRLDKIMMASSLATWRLLLRIEQIALSASHVRARAGVDFNNLAFLDEQWDVHRLPSFQDRWLGNV